MPVATQELIRVVDTRPIVRQVAREAFGDDWGQPLLDGSRLIGTRYDSSDATACFFDEIVPADLTASGEDQTTSIFETIERVLKTQGMEFGNLVRTWFYLDKILDWYDGFNAARTPFLKSRGILNGLVPASTGIGIANRWGAAVVAGAMAIAPKRATIQAVDSPLQCSALDYKSSFSRAVEVARAGHRELYISGTASIEPGGKTAHVGNTRGQINLTMEVAAAILKSRGMDWRHTTRAIAYVKDPCDAPLLEDYLREHDLKRMPLTWMHADVCRDDLLFEIELDAATTGVDLFH